MDIVVEPIGEVWAVRVPGAEPQIFSRGGQAEDAAKAVAVRLASTGEPVEVHMKLRDGRPGGRFVCLPPIADHDEPLLVGGPPASPVRDGLRLTPA